MFKFLLVCHKLILVSEQLTFEFEVFYGIFLFKHFDIQITNEF